MSLSSVSTPSPSSSDERRDQQLQQNLATFDSSFIARDASSSSSIINTRAPHFPSLALAPANINERRLLQTQDIDHTMHTSSKIEHHASKISGEDDRMSSQQPQQPTPLPYAYDDGRAISDSNDDDGQSLIQLAQALEHEMQKDHTQRQLQVVDVPPARSRSDTADRIAQQSETTISNKDDDDDSDIDDVSISVLSHISALTAHTRSLRDSLTLGYDAQIREYNRLNQAHMQKKQQSRPNDQMGNVDMHENLSSNNDTLSDLASHPINIENTTKHPIPIESRLNETNDDVGEGGPYVDLNVLEAQLRERVHVSSHFSGDNVLSNNTESSSQLGKSIVPSTYEDVGISVHALEAQLREYERLNSAHIQQQQQSPSSRELIESIAIEEERKVAYKNDTAVGASGSGTSDLRNNSGVSDRFVKNYVDVATLNQTEQNTSSVICSSCNCSLYTVPTAELFICQVCRNIATMP